jgi:pimeloyl-ACP methyl ester carboxylesterase
MLLHGNAAHLGWWSFLAPLLAGQYRVVALSFSGMGASSWRDAYSVYA